MVKIDDSAHRVCPNEHSTSQTRLISVVGSERLIPYFIATARVSYLQSIKIVPHFSVLILIV